MRPTRHERRLREIQYKICDLGHADAFNLPIRREALAKLETMFEALVKRERAETATLPNPLSSLCAAGTR